MLKTKLEKSVYIPGALEVIVSSNAWRVMQPTTILRADFVIATLPSGAGQTVINIIKNNDSEDIVYTASFNSMSSNTIQVSQDVTLAAGDTLSIVIPEVAATTSGEDLLIQFLYFN